MPSSSPRVDSTGSRFGLARLFVAVTIAAIAAWFARLAMLDLDNAEGNIVRGIGYAHLVLVILAVAIGVLYRQTAILAIAVLWLLMIVPIWLSWLFLPL
jgi:hypothetical protein